MNEAPLYAFLGRHFRMNKVQGYLAHKKERPSRTLQQDHASGYMVFPGGVDVSYERGTPVPVKPHASLKLAARQPACTARGGAPFNGVTSPSHSCFPPNGHLLPRPPKPRGAPGGAPPHIERASAPVGRCARIECPLPLRWHAPLGSAHCPCLEHHIVTMLKAEAALSIVTICGAAFPPLCARQVLK